MIRYALKCTDGHGFDSWFASAGAFDALRRAGRLACPTCGSGAIDKALMAPGVSGGDAGPVAASPETPLARLKAHVENHADYVGKDFAAKARAMHDGSEPHRPIYGEAALPDARRLVRDGVPIAPLPFVPKSRVN